jgi:hypothetical protein
MSDDIIQFQRIAAGYVPGRSETFLPGASPLSAKLQNCIVKRAPAAIGVVGIYDILVGPSQDVPNNTTALRAKTGPAPVGLGGLQVNSPPLNVAGGGIIVDQGRATFTARSILTNPPTTVSPNVTHAVQYGAEFGAVPIYPGFLNTQLIRVIFTDGAGDATDVDFDFSIERVIDPDVEP